MSDKGAVGLDECMPKIVEVKENVFECWSVEGGWTYDKTMVIPAGWWGWLGEELKRVSCCEINAFIKSRNSETKQTQETRQMSTGEHQPHIKRKQWNENAATYPWILCMVGIRCGLFSSHKTRGHRMVGMIALFPNQLCTCHINYRLRRENRFVIVVSASVIILKIWHPALMSRSPLQGWTLLSFDCPCKIT